MNVDLSADQQKAAETILKILMDLPWADRPDVFTAIRDNDVFCCACGQGSVERPNPYCHCQNDE